MCWCEDFEFTVNRADEYMVRRKPYGVWYVVPPPVVLELVQQAVDNGSIHVSQRLALTDGPSFIHVALLEDDSVH